MLLEVVEDRLNLRSAFEQLPLALGHDLFGLLVVRWREDECAEGTFHLPVQWRTTVASVTDSYVSVLVDQNWYCPTVVNKCVGEGVGTQSTSVVDTGVQLEAVVLTLPVVTSARIASGYAVPPPTH